jgi:hypothetical protein
VCPGLVACRRGDAELVITNPAKLAALAPMFAAAERSNEM